MSLSTPAADIYCTMNWSREALPVEKALTVPVADCNGGMAQPKPLPPRLASRPFTYSRALEAGVSVGRLRAGDLISPSRSVRVPKGGSRDLSELCRAYVELIPDAVVSHGTAGLLHGLVLPERIANERQIHLSRDPASAVPRRRGVVGHRLALEPGEIVRWQGLPVTAPHRTWLDLAGSLALDDLVVAGDQLISGPQRPFGPRRKAMIRQTDLERYIASKPRMGGLVRAREALRLIRPGVDSPPETRLRLLLLRVGLPEFSPNTVIFDETGNPAVWTDLGCRRYRTCIEYEGSHHLSPGQQSRDHERDLLTAELGWHQVKINRFDVSQGREWVIAKVRHALEKGGWAAS